jgi:hypothetical protein
MTDICEYLQKLHLHVENAIYKADEALHFAEKHMRFKWSTSKALNQYERDGRDHDHY